MSSPTPGCRIARSAWPRLIWRSGYRGAAGTPPAPVGAPAGSGGLTGAENSRLGLGAISTTN